MADVRHWLNRHPRVKGLIRLPGKLIAPVLDLFRLRFLLKYGNYFRLQGSYREANQLVCKKSKSESGDLFRTEQGAF